MKRVFTFFVGILATLMAFAESPFQNKLTIYSAGTANIKVVLGDDRFSRGDNRFNSYEGNNNEVVITGLQSGYHTVSVYESRNERGRGWGFGKRNRSDNHRQLYTTSVLIRPFVHVEIAIDRFGRAQVREMPIRTRRNNDRDRDFDDNNRRRNNDWDSDYDRNRDREYDRGRERDNDMWRMPAMNVNQYNALRQTMHREAFDKGKLAIADQALRNNYLTSAQVKELAMLFAFDDVRLEFAKNAYSRTVDRGSFFMVYDVFTFSNNKERLAEYIRNYR